MKKTIRDTLLSSASSFTIYMNAAPPTDNISDSRNGNADIEDDQLTDDDMETVNQILAHSEFKDDPYAAFSEVNPDEGYTGNVFNDESPWEDYKNRMEPEMKAHFDEEDRKIVEDLKDMALRGDFNSKN